MSTFTVLGADCTVFDYPDRQLEAEKIIALSKKGWSNDKKCYFEAADGS